MIKKIIAFTIAVFSVFTLTACNKQIIDTTWKYDRAIIYLPDNTIVTGKIDSWKDYKDGDQIQVRVDGITYLVHSSNIVLISE